MRVSRLTARALHVLQSEGVEGIWRRFKRALARALLDMGYDAWVRRYGQPTHAEQLRIRREAAQFAYRPLISIVMPAYDADGAWLRGALDSVLGQCYPGWELCIVSDILIPTEIKQLLEQYSARDARIKVKFREDNNDSFATLNTALDAAPGEFMAFMGAADLISTDALFQLVKRLNEDRSLDLVYSDEDRLDAQGRRHDPFFKPDWSPEYLESTMYTSQLSLYRKTLVRRIGGFRRECDGAQDFDFVLRFTELTERIGHVARVLYHKRTRPGPAVPAADGADPAVAARIHALEERLHRTGRTGTVTMDRRTGCLDARVALPRAPLVSIIIPSAGHSREIRGKSVCLVSNCVEHLRRKSTYRNYEIIIVDERAFPEGLWASLGSLDCRRVTDTETRFNFSRKINLGAGTARGEYLLLLNDDIEVIAEDWIERMLEQALKPGVGAVGAKLLHPEGTLQHAGIVHYDGLPVHVRYGYPREDTGYRCSTVAIRNYLAVTAACMLTPVGMFQQVGGFPEDLNVSYNDVDYCLKLRERGWRTVYTPLAELYHLESATRRKTGTSREERELFLERWRAVTLSDPYYNAEYLRTAPPDFSLRLRPPPRGRMAEHSAS